MDDRRRRFEAIILPHLDAAYRYARWLTRPPPEPDDIVQDAMLRAFRGFDALRSADVKPWLLSIVRNCHSTALTRQQRRSFVPLPEEHEEEGGAMTDDSPGPEGASMRRDEERTLERLLSGLAPEQREILILREIEELDYREIAAITQVPIGTVMSRLARARAALKARWLQDDQEQRHAMR
jgi:RNA polymerase sigma-70 factor, ECF subfamily